MGERLSILSTTNRYQHDSITESFPPKSWTQFTPNFALEERLPFLLFKMGEKNSIESFLSLHWKFPLHFCKVFLVHSSPKLASIIL